MFAAALLAVTALPIRGLHIFAPDPAAVPQFTHFIRDALPKEGVNTLVLEIGYRYQFKSHPEVASDAPLSFDQIREIVSACKDAHVRFIPEMNLLGHQSWAEHNEGLLASHPEFDETPGKFPKNKGLYCRSYCPLAPGLHKVLFEMIDELADACQADAFHVGMDEVMTLADPDCPRCHGRPTAELFAGEVNRLHDHLKAKGLQMWMWGDRFIDGKSTGIGDWSASGNGTQDAVHHVPKDIIVNDWQYDHAEPTAAYFVLNGLPVVTCSWRKPDVALEQLAQQRSLEKDSNPRLGKLAMGMMETTWVDCDKFVAAYYGDAKAGREPVEAAKCFKTLCKAMRE